MSLIWTYYFRLSEIRSTNQPPTINQVQQVDKGWKQNNAANCIDNYWNTTCIIINALFSVSNLFPFLEATVVLSAASLQTDLVPPTGEHKNYLNLYNSTNNVINVNRGPNSKMGVICCCMSLLITIAIAMIIATVFFYLQ